MILAEGKRAKNVPEPSGSIAENEGYAQVFQEDKTGKEFMPKGGFEPDSRPPTNRTSDGQTPDISGQAA